MRSRRLLQRAGERGPVFVGVDLGRSEHNQVRQVRPTGKQARHGHAGENAVRREAIDQRGRIVLATEGLPMNLREAVAA